MCFVIFWESGINNIRTSEVVPLGNQAGTKYKPKIDPSKLAAIEGEMATEICFTFLKCLRCLCVCRYPHGIILFFFFAIIFKENNTFRYAVVSQYTHISVVQKNMDLAEILIC